MKLLQIAFIATLGTTCLVTVATSKALHAAHEGLVQEFAVPAPSTI